MDTPVFKAVRALLAIVVVQQLVKALLDEFVGPGEHEEQLGERADDQGLRAFLLLREKTALALKDQDILGTLGSFYKKTTYKLCKLFITDGAVSTLETLRVQDTALGVDVTEAYGCQDFYRCRFLNRKQCRRFMMK